MEEVEGLMLASQYNASGVGDIISWNWLMFFLEPPEGEWLFYHSVRASWSALQISWWHRQTNTCMQYLLYWGNYTSVHMLMVQVYIYVFPWVLCFGFKGMLPKKISEPVYFEATAVAKCIYLCCSFGYKHFSHQICGDQKHLGPRNAPILVPTFLTKRIWH